MLSWMVGIEYDQTSNFSDVAVPPRPGAERRGRRGDDRQEHGKEPNRASAK